MEKEAVEDDEESSSDDEEGDSSSDEVDEEDEEEGKFANVGPSFVKWRLCSATSTAAKDVRPSAKGRTSAGLRASEPRTVGGRETHSNTNRHAARADSTTNINKTTGDDGDTPIDTVRSKEEDQRRLSMTTEKEILK